MSARLQVYTNICNLYFEYNVLSEDMKITLQVLNTWFKERQTWNVDTGSGLLRLTLRKGTSWAANSIYLPCVLTNEICGILDLKYNSSVFYFFFVKGKLRSYYQQWQSWREELRIPQTTYVRV